MSAAVITNQRAAEVSPRSKARMAGVLYLLEGAPAVLQQSIIAGLIVLGALTHEQVQALALLFLNLHTQAFNIYLIFFGFWLIPTGYLILRSTFFPRVICVLVILDGLGWATFLWPPLATSVYPVISVVAALAEIPLALWLLVVGVNVHRWKEQASKA
jgi:hypothetical protein